MKIAVNTRLLLTNRLEGIGWFMFETLQRMCVQHPEDEFYFLFDRPYDPSFIFAPNVTPLVCHPQARHPFLYYLWFGFSLPAALKKIKPDVFLSPDGYIPLTYKGKIVNVFHDLNFEHYPADIPGLERWYYRRYFPRFARRADRIATVSGFSKQDIQSLYGIPPDKIDIVYNGVNEAYHPLGEEEKAAVRERYSGGTPFFLFVGSLHPRKNLARLFAAYDLFRSQDNPHVKLLIVGAKKWWTPMIREAYENMHFKDDVVFTGRLPVSELKGLMASSLALTYVSYFEGFGIPILEAFASGTAVITSNVTSMPEIAGEAALLVDPFSEASIAEAMKTIALDDSLRQSLVEKGKNRLNEFSWQKSSERLYHTLQKTVHSDKKDLHDK